MVTVQKEIRYRPHMVTGVQEEIPNCWPGTSSGKQKKAHPASQPHFRNDNTHATIEADQILLAFQQWQQTAIQPNQPKHQQKFEIV